MTWNFYLPDYDRSTPWTNHGTVLQMVCSGDGETPEAAWADALAHGEVPEGFSLPETLLVIPSSSEWAFNALAAPDVEPA